MSRLYAKGKRLQQVIRMHHFFYNWPFWKDVKHPSWTFVFVSPVCVCVCYCIRYYLQCKCEEKKRAHSSKSDSFCWIVQWEWKMLGKICKWEKRSHTINVEPNAENRWQNHKGKWLVIIWLVRFVVGWQCNCFRLMFRTKCTECSFLWALLLFNMPSKMSRMMLRRRTRKKNALAILHVFRYWIPLIVWIVERGKKYLFDEKRARETKRNVQQLKEREKKRRNRKFKGTWRYIFIVNATRGGR